MQTHVWNVGRDCPEIRSRSTTVVERLQTVVVMSLLVA